MFGKICVVRTEDGTLEGVLLDYIEEVATIVYISNHDMLRCSTFIIDPKIVFILESYKEYFDLLFDGQIDFDEFHDLATNWE